MLPLNNITFQSHIPFRLQQLDLLLPSAGPLSVPSFAGEGIRQVPVSVVPPALSVQMFTRHHQGLPGIRCSTCAANGADVWVIPGRACGFCRTPAMRD